MLVKVKKINLKNYTVQVPTPEGMKDVPYDVMQSIENIVCASGQSTSQRLSPSELLARNRLLVKMRAETKKDIVLLSIEDYNVVKAAFDAFSGVGLPEVELCKRVLEAEDVEVEEKKGKKKGKSK